MAARLIDGKAVAASVRERLAAEVPELSERLGRPPGLATVLVGDDPASHVYVRNKRQACEEAGIASIHRELPAETAQEELVAVVGELNRTPEVDGILVQLPLPDGIDQDAVVDRNEAAK